MKKIIFVSLLSLILACPASADFIGCTGGSGSGSSGLTVGTTTIASGTNKYIEFNNNGILGEYANSGTGTHVVLTSTATPLTGDITYWNGTNWVDLGIGSSTQVLTVSGGIPSWAAPAASGGITLLAVRSPTGVATDTQGSIPSTAKRIVVNFSGLEKTSGTDDMGMEVGDAGGIITSGYQSGSARLQNSTTVSVATSTSNIHIDASWNGNSMYGSITFNLVDATNNIWTYDGAVYSGSFEMPTSGTVTLGSSNTLTQIQMVGSGGSAGNFGGGSWEVSYQ